MNTDQIPICLCCKYPLDDESIEAGEHSMCQNVCPVCNGDGRKECDVETTTGTVKQYDGPCDKCGGTGLVKPSASVQPLNDQAEASGARGRPIANPDAPAALPPAHGWADATENVK